MGWTYTYKLYDTRKEACLEYATKGWKDGVEFQKMVFNKSDCYLLMKDNNTNKQFIICLLTKFRKWYYFGYKDIDLMYEKYCYVPKSILRDFNPSNEEERQWKERQIEYHKMQPKKEKYKDGDIVLVTPDFDISWLDGYYTKRSGESFKVYIEKDKRTNRLKYIVNHFYRLTSKTFNCIQNKVKL